MHKILSLIVVSICVFQSSKAQDSSSTQEIQTLLGSDIKVSGFGGLLTTYSTVGNEFMQCTGGGGGILLNRSLFLGGFGLGAVNNIRLDNSSSSYRMTDFGYGGLWLGYNFMPDRAVHFGIDSKFGWGSANYSESGFITDGIYVVHPGAFAEANITQWFKVNTGLGYRAVFGADEPYFSNKQLSSPNVSLGFLFGWFN